MQQDKQHDLEAVRRAGVRRTVAILVTFVLALFLIFVLERM